MNKSSVISGIKFATLSLFFAAVLSTGTAFAEGTNNSTEAAANAKSLNVKYVTSNEEGFIFNVKYDNLSSAEFELVIKDENGEVLYQKSFDEKNFNKKYQLSRSIVKAVFIIRTKDGNEQSLEAAVQTRQTEDIVISRL